MGKNGVNGARWRLCQWHGSDLDFGESAGDVQVLHQDGAHVHLLSDEAFRTAAVVAQPDSGVGRLPAAAPPQHQSATLLRDARTLRHAADAGVTRSGW